MKENSDLLDLDELIDSFEIANVDLKFNAERKSNNPATKRRHMWNYYWALSVHKYLKELKNLKSK